MTRFIVASQRHSLKLSLFNKHSPYLIIKDLQRHFLFLFKVLVMWMELLFELDVMNLCWMTGFLVQYWSVYL